MGWELLNKPMLWGLAGLALPLLAHLLTRRRFDRVPWAAMQFLELERDARRRVRLEELQLILLRMLLVAVLVIALARPADHEGILANWLGDASKDRRDLVIVIDGSSSMGWRDGPQTPHAASIQFAHRVLETLGPGDRVALLEARSDARPIVSPPSPNHDLLRRALGTLPSPSGTADLPAAIRRAASLLRDSTQLRREVLVITDNQAAGFRAADAAVWEQLDGQLNTFPDASRPVVRIATPGEPRPLVAPHFHVAPLELSRNLVPHGLPVTVRTRIGSQNTSQVTTRQVTLELNGHRLPGQTVTASVPADGAATVDFTVELPSPGSHLVAVSIDDDPLPADNRSLAVVHSVDALPVLLVDGAPHADLTRSETFFARAAVSASNNEHPWIAAQVVSWDRFDPSNLPTGGIVVLANVARPDPAWNQPLTEFVRSGGGLLVTLGDRTSPDDWNRFQQQTHLLPARLASQPARSVVSPTPPGTPPGPTRATSASRLDVDSLAGGWMSPFATSRQGGFADARFSVWWRLSVPQPAETGTDGPTSAADPERPSSQLVPSIDARLDGGDPLLMSGRLGRGHTAIWASSLDADWNTLPARPDYVSFLHELLFHLAAGHAAANLSPGQPILWSVPPSVEASEYMLIGPGGTRRDLPAPTGNRPRVARVSDTLVPGHYVVLPRDPGSHANSRIEQFAIIPQAAASSSPAHSESQLARLSPESQARLESGGRVQFVGDVDGWQRAVRSSRPQTEFWYLMLFVFLGLLIGELLMTRKLVQGGYQQEGQVG